MKSSPSEIYSKTDDSMMEGKSTLSALSIYLPAREWQVIKIYWKLGEKKSLILIPLEVSTNAAYE